MDATSDAMTGYTPVRADRAHHRRRRSPRAWRRRGRGVPDPDRAGHGARRAGAAADPTEVTDQVAAFARELGVDEGMLERRRRVRRRDASGSRRSTSTATGTRRSGRRSTRRRCTPAGRSPTRGTSRCTTRRWPPGGAALEALPAGHARPADHRVLPGPRLHLSRACPARRRRCSPSTTGSTSSRTTGPAWSPSSRCSRSSPGANDDPRAFSLLAMVVSLFETGYLRAGAGLFEASPGQLSREGVAERHGRRHATRRARRPAASTSSRSTGSSWRRPARGGGPRALRDRRQARRGARRGLGRPVGAGRHQRVPVALRRGAGRATRAAPYEPFGAAVALTQAATVTRVRTRASSPWSWWARCSSARLSQTTRSPGCQCVVEAHARVERRPGTGSRASGGSPRRVLVLEAGG